MNKIRREQISKVIGMIGEARCLLDDIRWDEEQYRDNIPENLQGSERYEKADEAVYEMEDIVSELEEFESRLEEVIA